MTPMTPMNPIKNHFRTIERKYYFGKVLRSQNVIGIIGIIGVIGVIGSYYCF
jgi:hypothetical protein